MVKKKLSREEMERIRKEVKELDGLFKKVYKKLLINKELYGSDAVLVRTENGSGWGDAKLPKGATYFEAVNALFYLIRDLSIDLGLREK